MPKQAKAVIGIMNGTFALIKNRYKRRREHFSDLIKDRLAAHSLRYNIHIEKGGRMTAPNKRMARFCLDEKNNRPQNVLWLCGKSAGADDIINAHRRNTCSVVELVKNELNYKKVIFTACDLCPPSIIHMSSKEKAFPLPQEINAAFNIYQTSGNTPLSINGSRLTGGQLIKQIHIQDGKTGHFSIVSNPRTEELINESIRYLIESLA